MTKTTDQGSSNRNNRSRLLSEIKEALRSVSYGSIEIFVQNKVVTQITVRNIKKTSVEIEEPTDEIQSQELRMFQSSEKQIRKTLIRRAS